MLVRFKAARKVSCPGAYGAVASAAPRLVSFQLQAALQANVVFDASLKIFIEAMFETSARGLPEVRDIGPFRGIEHFASSSHLHLS
jgi:hypothetical protein